MSSRKGILPFAMVSLFMTFSLSGCSLTALQPSGTTPKITPVTQTTHKQGPKIIHYKLKLAQIIFAGNGVSLITTHGTMQTEYVHPIIQSGKPKVFKVLLRSISPWKFKTSVRTMVRNSPIADAMELVPNGADLFLIIYLKPHVHSFQTLIGGGDIIEFLFK